MTAFSHRVAELIGVNVDQLERLSGGDLSEILLVRRNDGHPSVVKGGAAISTEIAMLRAIAAAGLPTPHIEAEYPGVALLEYVPNDRVFSPAAWREIGEQLRKLHDRTGPAYGWSSDYRIGTVELDNRQISDWPRFWGEQRLAATASLLDRPWRDRIHQVVARLPELLPPAPEPSHLHGDLWTGNILVSGGRLAALIDPACYFGDREVDLAMLTLFAAPLEEFWDAYGPLEPEAARRRPVYQLFPALVHLRLFGRRYAPMVEALLDQVGTLSQTSSSR